MKQTPEILKLFTDKILMFKLYNSSFLIHLLTSGAL